MRKTLRDLLEPYVSKATVDRETVHETKRLLTNISKRLHDVEHLMFKGQEPHTLFDEFNKKFGEIDVKFAMLDKKAEDDGRREAARNEEVNQKIIES